MTIESWDEARFGPLSEAAMRQRLEGEGYRVASYVYPPGTRFDDHTHACDKKDGVLSGRFRITMHGEDFVLGAGDIIAVPAGAVHAAEVVGTEAVVSLDAVKLR